MPLQSGDVAQSFLQQTRTWELTYSKLIGRRMFHRHFVSYPWPIVKLRNDFQKRKKKNKKTEVLYEQSLYIYLRITSFSCHNII